MRGYSAEHRQAQQQMTQQYLQRQQQQQSSAGAAAQAPASGGPATVGNESTIEITGGADPTIGGIARGVYAYVTQNHGRPAYKKTEQVNGVDVMIYYWDERDGPNFSGWWLGPQIGGDQVWAYQPDRSAPYVPTSGWKVPYHSAVDPTFVVSKARSAPAAMADQQKQRQEQQKLQQQQEQQRLEQQRRVEEQRKKFQEETLRKQQEQSAVAAVRRVMQKMWTVTEEGFEAAKAEVDNALVQNTTNLGSLLEKMKGDIKTCIDQAEKRIEEEKASKRKHQEQTDKAQLIAKEIGGQLEAVDTEITKLREVLEQFEASSKENPGAENPNTWVEEFKEKVTATKEKVKASGDQLSKEMKEMYSSESSTTTEPSPQLTALTGRTTECGRRLDSLLTAASFAVQRAKKKVEAKAKMAAIESVFDKYDGNKDGAWSIADVKKYAQGELSLKLTDELLKPILRVLGVQKEVKKVDFHRLKMALGILRERQIDERRRNERLDREKELEALKAALQTKVDEACTELKELEEKVQSLDQMCGPLNDKALAGTSPPEIATKVGEAGESAQEIHTRLESMKKVVESLMEEVDPAIKAFAALQHKALDFRVKSMEMKVTKAQKTIAHARNVGERKARQELVAIEGKVLTALRSYQRQKDQSTSEFFAAAAGDKESSLDVEGFKTLVREAQEAVGKDTEESAADEEKETDTLDDSAVERVFNLWQGSLEEGLDEEVFTEHVRLYYRVVKEAGITEGMDVESSIRLRLEVGDAVEAVCGGPVRDEASGCWRLRAKAVKDGTEGYVSTAGNAGTTFLQEVTEFRVVTDTVLTKTFDLEGDKEKQRTLKVGEIVEVKRWPVKDEKTGLTRLKCRCKGHLEYGFATSVGNRGAVFLQAV